MTWSQERAECRLEGRVVVTEEDASVTLGPGVGTGMCDRMMGASRGMERSTLSRETQTTLQAQQQPIIRDY